MKYENKIPKHALPLANDVHTEKYFPNLIKSDRVYNFLIDLEPNGRCPFGSKSIKKL